MIIQPRPPITSPQLISPLIVAAVAILLLGLLREPARQQFSAILVAGAGAAYLAGGLGPWELILCGLMSVVAFLGLRDYRWLGLGWMLHSASDVIHHLYGNPIIPALPLSSFGCAICDIVLAIWYFAGAPSPYPWVNRGEAKSPD